MCDFDLLFRPSPSLKVQLIPGPSCFESTSTTEILGSGVFATDGSAVAGLGWVCFTGIVNSSSGSSSSKTSAIGEAFAIADDRFSKGTSSGALSVLRCEAEMPLALCMALRCAENPRWLVRGLEPLGVLKGPSAASRSMTGLIMSESTRCSGRGCHDA